DALEGMVSPGWVERTKQAVLQGYRAPFDRSLAARIDLYTAARLFRQLNPFRYWQPRGRQPGRGWVAHRPERVEATFERIEALSQPKSRFKMDWASPARKGSVP